MPNLFLDTETRSRTPISRGTDLYAQDAECIIVTWALEEAPVDIWDVLDEPSMPRELEACLSTPEILLIAHNAAFDRNILTHALKVRTDMDRWRCTRAQACAHGLPGSLETLGRVLGLPVDKQKLTEDSALIQWFCVPRADGSFREPIEFPDKWATFKNYALRDTQALREIYRKLPSHNYE